MDTTNINKVIQFCQTRPWRTDNYFGDLSHCMVGIVGDALHGTREPKYYGAVEFIRDSLNISHEAARDLFILDDSGFTAPHGTGDFEMLDLPEQNRILVGVLERLRDSGGEKVEWKIIA